MALETFHHVGRVRKRSVTEATRDSLPIELSYYGAAQGQSDCSAIVGGLHKVLSKIGSGCIYESSTTTVNDPFGEVDIARGSGDLRVECDDLDRSRRASLGTKYFDRLAEMLQLKNIDLVHNPNE